MDAPRVQQGPLAVVQAPPAVEAAGGARWQARQAAGVARRLVLVLAALALFALALQVLKAGAGGLSPVLREISAHGTPNLLGFGWLGAYAVLSGSPVAAVALSLYSGGVLSDTETFAMIGGSRLGASFIVLFVGFLYYLRRLRDPDGIYIGVVALLVAFTLWTPVIPLGQLVLRQGWFDGVRMGSPGAVRSLTSLLFDPVVDPAKDRLPSLALFGGGVGLLLVAFTLFDRVLPNLEQPGPRFERLSALLQQRWSMFAFGLGVTAMTMSVSLSVTILVPLALKGYVRRQNIIPYVMGANVATWVDTLFAALLLGTPRAFTIVFTVMALGAAVSLLVLLFFYEPYRRLVLQLAHLATRNRRAFALFLGVIFLVPGVLMAV